MSRRGGFVTELIVAVAIATLVGVAFLLATGELGAAWEALRDDEGVEESGDAARSSPTVTPTTARASVPGLPPPDETHYTNVSHISSELDEGGLPCQDTNVHVRDEAAETGTCASPTGAEVTIFVYKDLDSLPASFDEFNEATEGEVLEGPNWFLTSTDAEFLSDAQGILGGDLREL